VEAANKGIKRYAWRDKEAWHLKYMREIVGVPKQVLRFYAALRRSYLPEDREFRDKVLWAAEIELTERFGQRPEPKTFTAREWVDCYRRHPMRCWAKTKRDKVAAVRAERRRAASARKSLRKKAKESTAYAEDRVGSSCGGA
jgi:hypothetical protein